MVGIIYNVNKLEKKCGKLPERVNDDTHSFKIDIVRIAYLK